jgi:UPF0176 protein
MKNRGFAEVYQIEGGVVRYGETFGDDGLWEGSLFVFDGRMNQEFRDHPSVISHCERCATPTTKYYNCGNLACRTLLLLCDDCAQHNDATACTGAHVGRR